MPEPISVPEDAKYAYIEFNNGRGEILTFQPDGRWHLRQDTVALGDLHDHAVSQVAAAAWLKLNFSREKQLARRAGLNTGGVKTLRSSAAKPNFTNLPKALPSGARVIPLSEGLINFPAGLLPLGVEQAPVPAYPPDQVFLCQQCGQHYRYGDAPRDPNDASLATSFCSWTCAGLHWQQHHSKPPVTAEIPLQPERGNLGNLNAQRLPNPRFRNPQSLDVEPDFGQLADSLDRRDAEDED